jgi:hypothetical protein
MFFLNRFLKFTFIIKKDDKIISELFFSLPEYILFTEKDDSFLREYVENFFFFNIKKFYTDENIFYIFGKEIIITFFNKEIIINELSLLNEKIKEIFTNFGKFKYFNLNKNFILLRGKSHDKRTDDMTSLYQEFEYTL